MRKLFVFDLDDTLLHNVHDYANPILAVPKIIIDTLGPKAPHAGVIVEMMGEIDRRRVHEANPATGEPFLYSMERFPGSCVETYRKICARIEVAPDPLIESFLYDVGMTAFDENRYHRNIVPGAKRVLDFLAAQGDTLILLTKGDPRVQRRKLKALQAKGIKFDTVAIVKGDKTPRMFRNAHSYYPNRSPISVGNSYESDILPALEAGYFGIYIPLETWETLGRMEEIRTQADTTRCRILDDLTQIIEIYGRLP